MQISEVQGRALAPYTDHAHVIGLIASRLGADWFPSSQRAELKRHRADRNGRLDGAALQLLAAAGCPIETAHHEELRKWIILVHCMALLSGPNCDPHSTSPEAHPGRMLHKSGYTSYRLNCLVEARGERLYALLEGAIRRIATLGEPVNWSKIAPLILAHDPESSWVNYARLELVRGFYARASKDEYDRSGTKAESGKPLLSRNGTDD